MALDRLDHYEILEQQQGEYIYKARDTRSGEIVAIKLQPSWQADDEELRARFRREIKVERLLDHPNLARFIDVGVTQVPDRALQGRSSLPTPVIYLVREYVDGESLRAMLGRGRPTVARTIEISIQVARGLDVLHGAGIVHRGVKPENIRINKDGVVKLVDFGLVKIIGEVNSDKPTFQTEVGRAVGTNAYFAPEQVRSEDVDAATDLFALGVLMYEMLTGQLPFPVTNPVAYFRAVLNETPPPIPSLRPDVPRHLSRIVNRLLEKKMADRYPIADQVAVDLTRVMTELA